MPPRGECLLRSRRVSGIHRAHLLGSPHHLDVVDGQVRAVRRRAVENHLGESRVPTPEETIGRPARRGVERRSNGDEQHGMSIESSDQGVPLVQEVAVLTGELIRRDLIGHNAGRPDDDRDLQAVIARWRNRRRFRLRLS